MIKVQISSINPFSFTDHIEAVNIKRQQQQTNVISLVMEGDK